MRLRTSFTHEIEGTVIVSEPEGLTQAIIGLTRHPELCTLVKEFKTSMRLYGSNGTQDGRRDWFKNIETVYGPDAVVEELIEYSVDGFTFLELYSGEIGIQTVIEDLAFDHGLELTGVQKGFWRKAMSRWDVPVNIQAPTNLDGEAVTVYPAENLLLPTQIMRKTSIFATDILVGASGTESATTSVVRHAQIGLNTTREEIENTFNLPFELLELLTEIVESINLQEDSATGVITVSVAGDAIINASTSAGLITGVEVGVKDMLNYHIAAINQKAVGGSSPGLPNISETIPLSGTDTVTCAKGDLIKIFLTYVITTDTSATVDFDFNVDDFALTVVQDSIAPASNCPGFLIHDVIASVLDRISNYDLFYSELLGSPDTRARVYAEAGCYWNNIIAKGLHIRRYSLAEKQFAISMKDIWEGLNPHLNLSVYYFISVRR